MCFPVRNKNSLSCYFMLIPCLVICSVKLYPKGTLDCSQWSKSILFFFFFFLLFLNITAQVSSPHFILALRVVWCVGAHRFAPREAGADSQPLSEEISFSGSWRHLQRHVCKKLCFALVTVEVEKWFCNFLSLTFLKTPVFFPESVTTFQLKILSSQDQMKSFGSFHILLLILWIILSFLCTFCLISLMFLNCSEFLAWKNIILKLKLFPVYHFPLWSSTHAE